MNKTLTHYENNANKLINKYDNANMDKLHLLFNKYIKNNDTVLDIGFGSGRDIKNIMKITNNIFGLDACDKFIENMHYDNLKGRIAKSILPKIDLSKFQFNVDRFDVIVSIAVLMHLDILQIEQTVKNMKSILFKNGIIIISYSCKRKNIDERHFEPLTKDLMTNIFNNNNFIEIDYFKNSDVMNREIEWITQVYKLGEQYAIY